MKQVNTLSILIYFNTTNAAPVDFTQSRAAGRLLV